MKLCSGRICSISYLHISVSLNLYLYISVNQNCIKVLRRLVKFIKFETEYMQKCPECYRNWRQHSEWFTTVCEKPHCIVWAKFGNHSHWPGKVMSVNTDDNKVHVRFFGDHLHADVVASKCYLYTNDNHPRSPTTDKSSISDPNYKAAINVTNLFVFRSYH